LNFVKESTSKEDKRSKLLKLTPLGEKTLFKAYEFMSNSGALLSANLTDHQKSELIPILDYLNSFHANLYLNHKDDDVKDLIAKYVRKK
jgi:DNA-binding MarR family transcriptional regulator